MFKQNQETNQKLLYGLTLTYTLQIQTKFIYVISFVKFNKFKQLHNNITRKKILKSHKNIKLTGQQVFSSTVFSHNKIVCGMPKV